MIKTFLFGTMFGFKTISSLFPNNSFINQSSNMKVSELIVNRQWMIPEMVLDFIDLADLPILHHGEDKMIWCGNSKGIFSVSNALEKIRFVMPKVSHYKKIWSSYVHPTVASNVWKIVRGAIADDMNMKKRGFNMLSRCLFCHKEEDITDHLLWHCEV